MVHWKASITVTFSSVALINAVTSIAKGECDFISTNYGCFISHGDG